MRNKEEEEMERLCQIENCHISQKMGGFGDLVEEDRELQVFYQQIKAHDYINSDMRINLLLLNIRLALLDRLKIIPNEKDMREERKIAENNRKEKAYGRHGRHI